MAREFAPPQIPSQRVISRHGTTQPQPQPRPPRALSTIAISASHISKKPISLSKRTPARAAKVFSHPRLRSFPSRLDTTTATFHCPSLSPSSFLSLLLRQSLSAAMSNIQFLKLLVEVILIVLNILARDEAFGSLASFAQTSSTASSSRQSCSGQISRPQPSSGARSSTSPCTPSRQRIRRL